MDIGHGAHGVLHRVDGLHNGTARALVAPVLILGVRLLDVGAVDQHDLHQPGSEPGGPDLAGEALAHQHGDAPAVVNMGMGDQDIVNGIGRKGQLVVIDLILPLLQAAVDQDALSVDLQTVAAAGNAFIRSKETQLHGMALL